MKTYFGKLEDVQKWPPPDAVLMFPHEMVTRDVRAYQSTFPQLRSGATDAMAEAAKAFLFWNASRHDGLLLYDFEAAADLLLAVESWIAENRGDWLVSGVWVRNVNTAGNRTGKPWLDSVSWRYAVVFCQ